MHILQSEFVFFPHGQYPKIMYCRFMYDLRTMNALRFILHVLPVYDFHIQVHLLSFEA